MNYSHNHSSYFTTFPEKCQQNLNTIVKKMDMFGVLAGRFGIFHRFRTALTMAQKSGTNAVLSPYL